MVGSAQLLLAIHLGYDNNNERNIMKVAANIQRLRRDKGLSQEQLAEALDVSRQAVSRWESGDSVPEVDKLMGLSELFGVSLDELVNESSPAGKGAVDVAARKATFDQMYCRFANAIAGSIGLILLSLAPTVWFSDANDADGRAALFFLGAIVIAVPVIVYYSIMLRAAKDEMNTDLPALYTASDAAAYARPFAAQLVTGLCLILLSILYIVVIQTFISNDAAARWAPAGMFVALAAGVTLIIRAGILKSRFNQVSARRVAAIADAEGDNPLIGKICGTIMLSATLIYLLCGFLANMWGEAWVVFPVGGILCGIVGVIFGTNNKQ